MSTHVRSSKNEQSCKSLCNLYFRCIDKLEETVKKERSEKQALEKAKTAVLNCPMCGQTLNTEQVQTASYGIDFTPF